MLLFCCKQYNKSEGSCKCPNFYYFWRRHSANIEKSTISKAQKFIFCTRKKFKTNKNAIFGLFSSAKIDFLPFLKMQIMCFCTFEIALFFLILEHCGRGRVVQGGIVVFFHDSR